MKVIVYFTNGIDELRLPVPAGLLAQSTSDEGLSCSSGSCDEKIIAVFNPVTGEMFCHQGFIQSSWMRESQYLL